MSGADEKVCRELMRTCFGGVSGADEEMFCKPDVLKPDVLKPDVLKPDVLKPGVLWGYRFRGVSGADEEMFRSCVGS